MVPRSELKTGAIPNLPAKMIRLYTCVFRSTNELGFNK